ncbi:LRR receptor-like serine/threonine-protein kinase ERECTA [Hordeum vulgare]|uniref:Leucine-rich repeat-containing N-terminal plant-type domain-containing protein n=1 Tax=Hordeum vulgare subsp. vulgare TaxID=112509 RepID=A0A8I6XED7_HORVV|nr:probable inactive leucine-rich repeat receptor kinase XIAO [Hordeum vulgare subsp. vulgare]KAE8767705.1 LRR receptor-like serine/threonine-protein kinase ERECTA [Hordeum vulgare]
MAARVTRRPAAVFLILVAALLTVTIQSAAATLHPVDYLVLQAVRRALSDLPGSGFFASWDFTGDACGFAGVSCSGDGRVVTLALGDPRAGAPGLSGAFPSAALARLSALSSLSLVPGRVSGGLSSAVAALPSLRFLALSGNLISGNLPGGFSPALRTVDLSKNSFSGRIPSSLLQIRSLRTLVLSHNSLSGEIPKTVSSPLVHLDLRNNRLSGDVPPLPETAVYLSLGGNRLSGRVGGVLRRLTRLSFLDLGGNWFSGEVPGEVFSFRIGYLQLRKNAFSGELRPAGRLPLGATVDLSHNALSGRVPAELSSAAAVYLNGNKFAGAVPAEIVAAAEGGRMRVLFLQDNFLTGISVRGVPASAEVCAHWNCVAPPPTVVAACPAKGGRGRRRPPAQCGGRRG